MVLVTLDLYSVHCQTVSPKWTAACIDQLCHYKLNSHLLSLEKDTLITK